jgi:hypothetical protein
MTKKDLEDRLKIIEQHIIQVTANLNMLLGGKEETLYWLSNIKENEKKSVVVINSD